MRRNEKKEVLKQVELGFVNGFAKNPFKILQENWNNFSKREKKKILNKEYKTPQNGTVKIKENSNGNIVSDDIGWELETMRRKNASSSLQQINELVESNKLCDAIHMLEFNWKDFSEEEQNIILSSKNVTSFGKQGIHLHAIPYKNGKVEISGSNDLSYGERIRVTGESCEISLKIKETDEKEVREVLDRIGVPLYYGDIKKAREIFEKNMNVFSNEGAAKIKNSLQLAGKNKIKLTVSGNRKFTVIGNDESIDIKKNKFKDTYTLPDNLKEDNTITKIKVEKKNKLSKMSKKAKKDNTKLLDNIYEGLARGMIPSSVGIIEDNLDKLTEEEKDKLFNQEHGSLKVKLALNDNGKVVATDINNNKFSRSGLVKKTKNNKLSNASEEVKEEYAKIMKKSYTSTLNKLSSNEVAYLNYIYEKKIESIDMNNLTKEDATTLAVGKKIANRYKKLVKAGNELNASIDEEAKERAKNIVNKKQ